MPIEPIQAHIPVMTREVLHYLVVRPHGFYVDATFGAGGHSRAILEFDPTCTVLALDWDQKSLERYAIPLEEEFKGRFSFVWNNFALLYKILKQKGIQRVDGILADFGTSQMQLFERDGFSFFRDSPLDMRMSSAHQGITAAQVVNEAPEHILAAIFSDLGEERYGRKIARCIVHDRVIKSFTSTLQLAQLIARVVPRPRGASGALHPATRVFQALRIYVNSEIKNIEAFLPIAYQSLSPGGRLVCISFHSLEDRAVKSFFRSCGGTVITKKCVLPTQEEIMENRSSRSAKLRVIEKS